MSEIRYLLDENVNPLYRTELLKHEPTLVIWKVGSPGAPPLEASDPIFFLSFPRSSVGMYTYLTTLYTPQSTPPAPDNSWRLNTANAQAYPHIPARPDFDGYILSSASSSPHLESTQDERLPAKTDRPARFYALFYKMPTDQEWF